MRQACMPILTGFKIISIITLYTINIRFGLLNGRTATVLIVIYGSMQAAAMFRE